jgi:hypothetical protein
VNRPGPVVHGPRRTSGTVPNLGDRSGRRTLPDDFAVGIARNFSPQRVNRSRESICPHPTALSTQKVGPAPAGRPVGGQGHVRRASSAGQYAEVLAVPATPWTAMTAGPRRSPDNCDRRLGNAVRGWRCTLIVGGRKLAVMVVNRGLRVAVSWPRCGRPRRARVVWRRRCQACPRCIERHTPR